MGPVNTVIRCTKNHLQPIVNKFLKFVNHQKSKYIYYFGKSIAENGDQQLVMKNVLTLTFKHKF